MNISSNQGVQRRMLPHRGLVEETEIWKETVHAKIKHRTVVKLPRKIYVINMGKNVKRWRLRFILSFHHVKISHLSSSSIIQSCGLCPGQTPHPSNDKCHDTASNCREAAKKNLCHQHGKKCKKVKVYIGFSSIFNVRAVNVISWKFLEIMCIVHEISLTTLLSISYLLSILLNSLFRAVGCVKAWPPTHLMTSAMILHPIVQMFLKKTYAENLGNGVKR